MPREQVEWFMKESVHNSDEIQARQSCTYYSIVNVNKKNHPYLSSYEQEQTWTLTRTISNNHKRYQSSIENIHLTMPTSPSKVKHRDYENIKVIKNRSNSLIPLHKYTSLSPLYSPSTNQNRFIQQQQKMTPTKIIANSNSNMKIKTNSRSSLTPTRSMRTIPVTGDFIVRI